MITNSIIQDRDACLQITLGYIHPEARSNGVADFSLGTIDKQAKASGHKFLSCIRYARANAFQRWISKYGFKYRQTEFRKEL